MVVPYRSVAALAVASSLASTTAHAEPAQHSLGVGAGVSNFDHAIARIDYRVLLPRGTRWTVDIRGASVDRTYIDGFEARGGSSLRGFGAVEAPLLHEGPLTLGLRAGAGARVNRADRGPETESVAALAELGMIGRVRASSALELHAGVSSPLSVQLDPAVNNDITGALLVGGLEWRVTDRIALTADVESGGIFGSDGNAGKFLLRGFVGARFAFDEAASPPAAEHGSTDGLTAFVASGWRVLSLAGHISHGPDFQAGALLDGWLKLGVAGFSRPGPINPATFRRRSSTGESYRGSDVLDLRSDGAFLGLMAAPIVRLSDT